MYGLMIFMKSKLFLVQRRNNVVLGLILDKEKGIVVMSVDFS